MSVSSMAFSGAAPTSSRATAKENPKRRVDDLAAPGETLVTTQHGGFKALADNSTNPLCLHARGYKKQPCRRNASGHLLSFKSVAPQYHFEPIKHHRSVGHINACCLQNHVMPGNPVSCMDGFSVT